MANKHQVLELRRSEPSLSSTGIAERLNCTPEYVRATLSRANRHNPQARRKPGISSTWTEDQIAEMVIKREVERKRWSQIAKELGRPLSTCSYQYRQYEEATIAPKRDAVTPRISVPDEVWSDAKRRNLAPRTITSSIMGDPAPGQSALDKKQGAYA